MKYGAAYIRVSTDKQDEYSPDSQLKLIREYAKNKDYYVPDEFVFFDDGISGRSVKKRKSFNRMITAATSKEHPFDAIFVWKFSRFSRSRNDSVIYKAKLNACNVSLISITEPSIDGPVGGLIDSVFEWEAEYYSLRLSEEVKRGMTEKASRGEAMGCAPFGYKVKNKTFVADENADTVKWIFNEFLNGRGSRQIAVELGRRGVLTRRGNAPDYRFVNYILQNPVYVGKIRWSTDGQASKYRYRKNTDNVMIVNGTHKPIIDNETFDAVQSVFEERKKKYGKYQRSEQPVQFMLKGLVRCSNCGSTLVYVSTKEPSMQCHKYAKGQCNISHHLSIKKANEAVIAELKRCVEIQDFNILPQKKSDREFIDYDVLIKKEQEKIKRASDAYDAGFDTLEEYGVKKRTYLNKIEEYTRLKEEATPAEPDTAELKAKTISVLKLIESPDVSEQVKNEMLRSIIHHITYEKAKSNLKIYFYV